MASSPRVPGRSWPRVAVLFEPGPFSPFEINQAAEGLCEVVWVTGWAQPLPPALRRLLPGVGAVLDAVGLPRDRLARELRRAGIDGLVAFTEAAQEPAAALAAALGVSFHEPETAHRLCDRYDQRQTLRAAGIPGPAAVPVRRDALRSPADAGKLALRWPAVLKPRVGARAETLLLSEPRELLEALDGSPEAESLMLEEYLADRAREDDRPVADTVDVQLAVVDGVPRHSVISGRFPPVAPLRGTGGFLPSVLAAAEAAEVLDVAERAARALGVMRGLLEVEVKQTPDGPRVVTVTAGVGAIVPTLLAAVGGPSLLAWMLRLALGLELESGTPLAAATPVAFHYSWLAPIGQFVVRAVERFEAVRAMPEVERGWLNRGPGDRVSSRGARSAGHLASAYGAVPTHDDLWPLVARLRRVPTFRLDPVPPRVPV